MLALLNELAIHAVQAVSHGNFAALLALFLIAALTEVGIPFPFVIDGVLFLAGYRMTISPIHLLLAVGSLFLGRVVGASAIYWVFRLVDKPVSKWLSRRFPKLQNGIERLRLGARAPVAVAIGRLTPGLLTAVSVAAGGSQVYFGYFIAGIAISSIIADAALIILGFATQHGLHYLGVRPSIWMIIIGLIVFLVLVGLVYRWVTKRKSARHKSDGPESRDNKCER